MKKHIEVIERLMFVMPTHKVDGIRILPTLIEAKKALEKQMPKKPNLEDRTDYEGNYVGGMYICSICGRTICYEIEGNFEENYPYCNCGQKLDWSKESEDTE
jgi:hypothetical protein